MTLQRDEEMMQLVKKQLKENRDCAVNHLFVIERKSPEDLFMVTKLCLTDNGFVG